MASKQNPVTVGNHIVTVVWAFALIELICGCSLLPSIPSGKAQTVPMVTGAPVAPENEPYVLFTAVHACFDTPPNEPAVYGRAAAVALANKVDASVRENIGGLAVFASLITHNSLPTDQLTINVSAIAPFPSMPLQPTLGDDPLQNAKLRRDYTHALSSWQQTILQEQKTIAAIRQAVRTQTDKLRRIALPYDNTGSDIYGCLFDASQEFSHMTGRKVLEITSAMVNNETLQQTSNLNLFGAEVRITWRVCMVASVCQAQDAYWSKLLLSFHASSVTFYSPSYSQEQQISF